ncbi:MAG: hypothetical protein RIT27_684 [Pseudomonadota bacterium]|jgi:hypothetical protein
MLRKIAFFIILFVSETVFANPTVLMIGDETNTIYHQQLELVSRFYGFTVQNVPSNLEQLPSNEDIFLLVLTEQSINKIPAKIFFEIVQHKFPKIPVFVLGLTNKTPQNILVDWSQGKINNIQATSNNFEGFYQIEKSPLTHQLGGIKTPFQNKQIAGFEFAEQSSIKTLINFISKDSKKLPFFINLSTLNQELFFQAYVEPSPLNGNPIWRLNLRRFLEIAGLMMLTKTYCNEKCWYSESSYANLTIDDPWLVEPYGLLNYEKLLEEMNKTNFHTTIGFVPWNFDRDHQKKVIDIFKQNPQYFSLSVHGNNHDHREFYKYQTEKGDPWVAKPLELQEKNIRQAISRMEQFKTKTGLNYDPVFIFPHEIAPEQTLGLLKKYNFIATFNGGNIPLESKDPIDPLFYFRATSLDFANFTNVNRYGVTEYEEPQIALDLFLGNPILFFEHIILFAEGIDSFNKTASIVNRLQPKIKWAGLGEIARHLYLQRKIKENTYQIQMLSSSIQLENKTEQPAVFHIRKPETAKTFKLALNGVSQPYEQQDNEIITTISLAAHSSAQLDFTYPNDLNIKAEDVSKPNFSINFLRWISDFRDITFSGNFIGQYFIRAYYGSDAYQGGFKGLVLMGLGGLVIAILIIWYPLRKYRHSRHKELK